MTTTKLTDNEARALWTLDGRHFDNYGPAFSMVSDLDDWGLDPLELQNIKRQLPALKRKGMAVLTWIDYRCAFHLTEAARDAFSRWYHLEGGEDKARGW